MIYTIAGFGLDVACPDGLLLPSFAPFMQPGGEARWRVTAGEGRHAAPAARILEQNGTDLGEVSLGLTAEGLYQATVDGRHSICFHPRRTEASVALDCADPSADAALSAMLRIAFSQWVIGQGGFAIHASAVVRDGCACLFTGPSGAGKSTHAGLWLRHRPGTWLLNDDCPIIRVLPGGEVRAYGSPWSGKTPCYRPEHAPLERIERIYKAPLNRFTPLSGVEAFAELLPGCSVIHADAPLYESLCDSLAAVASAVEVGRCECVAHSLEGLG